MSIRARSHDTGQSSQMLQFASNAVLDKAKRNCSSHHHSVVAAFVGFLRQGSRERLCGTADQLCPR